MRPHTTCLMSFVSALVLTACGVAGPAGPAGTDGQDGVDGAKGAQGANGANGVDGVGGIDGIDGANGANGVDGTDGVDGVDGTDFPGPVPAEYIAADGILGGAAYSQWFATAAGGQGALANYAVTVASDFARCKACHAWDGQGNNGSYADRTGISTGTAARPDVAAVNLRAIAVSATYQELFDLVLRPSGRLMNSADNRHPDFTPYLTDAQVWNIVKFMREEWVDANELYDLTISGPPMHYEYDAATASWVLRKPTLTFSNIGTDGDAVAGRASYTEKCVLCHGADGTTLSLSGATLGATLRAKPYEVWFKAKFGQPPLMPPGLVTETAELKNLYKLLADPVAFP